MTGGDGSEHPAVDDYIRVTASAISETGREFKIDIEARGEPARKIALSDVVKDLARIMAEDRNKIAKDALGRDPILPMKLGAAVAGGFLIALLIASVWAPLPALILAAITSIAIYTITQVFYLRSVDGLSEAGTIELVRYALLNFLAPMLRGR
jgi:hypothetical protein